jgi:hypothetical protein
LLKSIIPYSIATFTDGTSPIFKALISAEARPPGRTYFLRVVVLVSKRVDNS